MKQFWSVFEALRYLLGYIQTCYFLFEYILLTPRVKFIQIHNYIYCPSSVHRSLHFLKYVHRFKVKRSSIKWIKMFSFWSIELFSCQKISSVWKKSEDKWVMCWHFYLCIYLLKYTFGLILSPFQKNFLIQN